MRDGQLLDVQVGDRMIAGKFGSPRDGKTMVVSELVEPAVADRLSRYGVAFRRVHESNWFTQLVSWLAGPLMVLGLWFFLSRRMMGQGGGAGLLGIGRSHAKMYME